MATTLTTGEILNGTIETTSRNSRVAILFIAVMAIVGTLLEWSLRSIDGFSAAELGIPEWLVSALGMGAGLGGLLFMVISIVANYLLWEAVLRSAGFTSKGGRRFFAYIGLSILTTIAIGLGLVLLIVPGLIIGARLALATPYLIGERRGVMDSMSDSWASIKGNTTRVVLAFLAGAVAFLVVFGIFDQVGELLGGEGGLVATLLQQIATHTGTVLVAAFSTYLFTRLHGASERLAETFT